MWEECSQTSSEQVVKKNEQRAWDTPLIKQTYNNLLQGSADLESRARLLGAASRESGAWLHTIPCSAIGTKLDDITVRFSVGQRIGSKLCVPFRCVCGAVVDQNARHPLHCKRSFGRYPRHEELNSIIGRSLNSAGCPSVLEPPGVCRSDGKRPDGITLFPWEKGLSLAWDATCVDTFAPSNVSQSVEEAGKAAAAAEVRKETKYEELNGRV